MVFTILRKYSSEQLISLALVRKNEIVFRIAMQMISVSAGSFHRIYCVFSGVEVISLYKYRQRRNALAVPLSLSILPF